ncbi:hypothetical protein [Flavobacterium koreense]
MKQLSFLLIIILLISCKSTEKTNGYGEQDTTCRKYENNITFVHNRFNPILKVVGKWRELSMNSEFYVNSKNKIAISNEKNEVLHLIVAKHHSCKLCKEGNKDMLHKHDPFLSSLKRKIAFWKNYEKYSIELLETNDENYAIYLLSNENEKRTVLFGLKNETFYDFILLNSKQEKQSQAKLLMDSYILN